MIHILKSNLKLGLTPAFNLPPVITCAEGVPCAALCYSRKAYERYSRNVAKPQWDENLEETKKEGFRARLIRAVDAAVTGPRRDYFRIHSAGDFWSEAYLEDWLEVASRFPSVSFLAFTKRYDWMKSALFENRIPPNFKPIFSLWFPMGKKSTLFPNAIVMEISGETRKADFVCPGFCPPCRHCWNARAGETIGFHLH